MAGRLRVWSKEAAVSALPRKIKRKARIHLPTLILWRVRGCFQGPRVIPVETATEARTYGSHEKMCFRVCRIGRFARAGKLVAAARNTTGSVADGGPTMRWVIGGRSRQGHCWLASLAVGGRRRCRCVGSGAPDRDPLGLEVRGGLQFNAHRGLDRRGESDSVPLAGGDEWLPGCGAVRASFGDIQRFSYPHNSWLGLWQNHFGGAYFAGWGQRTGGADLIADVR